MNDDDSNHFSLTLDVRDEAFPEEAPKQEIIEKWLSKALAHKCHSAEICIYLVDIEEMTGLNLQYRNKSGPTNILSFIYDAMPGQPAIVGDLVVCPPVLEQEANDAQIPLIEHWAHILIHGSLHVLGYDHQNDADAEIMEGLETSILQQLGYKNPYQ